MEKENELLGTICDYIYKADYKKRSNDSLIEIVDDYLKEYDLCFKYLFKELVFITTENKPVRVSAVNTILEKLRPNLEFVYRLLDNGKIVYVGQSTNVTKRIKQHKKNKDFNEVEICLCTSKMHMDQLEAYEIHKNLPKYNKEAKIHKVNAYIESGKVDSDIFKLSDKVDYDLIPCIPREETTYFEGYIYKYPFYIKNTKGIKPHWQKEN